MLPAAAHRPLVLSAPGCGALRAAGACPGLAGLLLTGVPVVAYGSDEAVWAFAACRISFGRNGRRD